jgi:hypothetical protein
MLSKVNMNAFDGNSKWDWFNADLNGLIYTWIVTLFFGVVLFGGLNWFNPQWFQCAIDKLAEVKNIISPDRTDIQMLGIMVLSMIPAFIIVFVCRRNFTVSGNRRQFRYFRRWI